MPDRPKLPTVARVPLADLARSDKRAVLARILRKPVVAPLEVAAFNSAI